MYKCKCCDQNKTKKRDIFKIAYSLHSLLVGFSFILGSWQLLRKLTAAWSSVSQLIECNVQLKEVVEKEEGDQARNNTVWPY